MRRVSITAVAVALALWCMPSSIRAQAPPQEPTVVTPKLNLTLEQRHTVKEFLKDRPDAQAGAAPGPEIGDTIPQNVRVEPIPSEVGQKVPQVKTHNFFIASGQIFIVDPKDNKVADVIKLTGD